MRRPMAFSRATILQKFSSPWEARLQPDQLPGHTAGVAAPQPLGRVLSVSGAAATIRLSNVTRAQARDDAQATVGKFLAIQTGVSSLVGIITKVAAEQGDNAVGHVDLLGEINCFWHGTASQRVFTLSLLFGS